MISPRLAIVLARFLVSVTVTGFSLHAQTFKNIDICVLIGKPNQYLSVSRIRTTAMLTWTKEGSFLWGRNCQNRGLHLIIEPSSTSERDKVWKALRTTGTWECPVAATFTGSLIKVHEKLFTTEFDAIEFRATEVESIHSSETTRGSWGK
jgi:hypothetical protein